MSKARFGVFAVVLPVWTLLTLLLLAPAASAADTTTTLLAPTSANGEPMALATTGLDIMVPVIIGITTLIIGIAVVAWAFLRTGPANQRH